MSRGVEVVENGALPTPLDHQIDDVRADETGAACDQDGHALADATYVRASPANAERAATTSCSWESANSGNIGKESTSSASISAAGEFPPTTPPPPGCRG